VVQTVAPSANKNDAATAVEDLFTPSAQTGQNQNTAEAAGLFQVSQPALFSAAAQLLLTQANTAPQNTVPAPATQPVATNAAAAASPAAANTIIVNPVTFEPAPAPASPLHSNARNPIILNRSALAPATTTSAPARVLAAPAANTVATTANVAAAQAHLQALNNSLAALGLPASDFARIDQIASITNEFDPVAFSALVTQLEAVGQPAAQQTTAANPAAKSSGAANTKLTNG